VSLTVKQRAKFEACIFSRSRDIRGSQNLKAGHVTQATLPCDLILYFWISTSWSPVELQISTWLDFCFGDIAIVRFWYFGWKMPIRVNFWRFLGILTPWKC